MRARSAALDPRSRATWCAASAWLVFATSCAGLVGLDVTYTDSEGESTSTATASSGGATGTGEATSSTASASSTGSTASGGGAGGDGAGGAGGDGGAGGVAPGAGGSGTGGACANDEGLDDAFDVDGPLDSKWTELAGNPEQETIDGYVVADSSLTFGSASSQWYGPANGGPFAYQTVEGDFLVWTRVRVTSDGVSDPIDTWHGAGLLLREPLDPPGDMETFVIAVVGTASGEGECRIGGNVDAVGVAVDLYSIPEKWPCSADIAICRRGGVTRVFGRESVSTPWLPIPLDVEAADGAFSDSLQIGPALYAWNEDGGPNEPTIGEFEHVLFEPICDRTCEEVLADLEAR